jgi:hypothetical protein
MEDAVFSCHCSDPWSFMLNILASMDKSLWSIACMVVARRVHGGRVLVVKKEGSGKVCGL